MAVRCPGACINGNIHGITGVYGAVVGTGAIPEFAVIHAYGESRGAVAVSLVLYRNGKGAAEASIGIAGNGGIDSGNHQIGHFQGGGTGSSGTTVGTVVAGGVGIIVRGVPSGSTSPLRGYVVLPECSRAVILVG